VLVTPLAGQFSRSIPVELTSSHHPALLHRHPLPCPAPKDQVVVECDAEELRALNELPRKRAILARGRRIAGDVPGLRSFDITPILEAEDRRQQDE